MKKTLLLMLLATAVSFGQSKQQAPVVYLTADSCMEPIGGNVSSILREKIRGSYGYILADKPPFEDNALGPEILLMCTDVPGEPITAVSFVVSFRMGRTRDISLHGLDIIGRAKVNEEAQSIFSKFDNWWTEYAAKQRQR